MVMKPFTLNHLGVLSKFLLETIKSWKKDVSVCVVIVISSSNRPIIYSHQR